MGKYYKKKEPTGREYVDAARNLLSYTTCVVEKFPDKWMELTLKPLYQAANDIAQETILANSVYIGKDQDEALLKNLKEREKHLTRALQMFNVYDYRFSCLMDRTNLMKSEEHRLKRIILQRLAESGVNVADPNSKNPERNIPSGEPVDANIWFGTNEICYEADGKLSHIKLGLTSRNVDHLLSLEKTAKDEIQKKLVKDRSAIKKLETKITA